MLTVFSPSNWQKAGRGVARDKEMLLVGGADPSFESTTPRLGWEQSGLMVVPSGYIGFEMLNNDYIIIAGRVFLIFKSVISWFQFTSCPRDLKNRMGWSDYKSKKCLFVSLIMLFMYPCCVLLDNYVKLIAWDILAALADHNWAKEKGERIKEIHKWGLEPTGIKLTKTC